MMVEVFMDIRLYRNEVQNWIKEIQKNRGTNPKKIIENCDYLEQYGQKICDDALIGFACFSRGEAYYLLNDMKNFYSQMLSCIPYMERIGEWGYVAMANNLLGIMSLNRGNVPYAMDYYMKSITICQNYRLPDLEWMIHMNMGALYLSIEEYQKALDHIENGYHYIILHPEIPNYILNLTVCYIGMGKAYLALEDKKNAILYNEKLEKECAHILQGIDQIGVLCYQSKLYHVLNKTKERDLCIKKIDRLINRDIPIMDLFDDIYEYLEMLLEIKFYDEFLHFYSLTEELIKTTTIKNLQRKIISLKIRYYQKTNQEEKRKEEALKYYELSVSLEKENHMMVINIIEMRNSLHDLVQINKEVEKENQALHKKSETDPLTGLYNRFRLNIYGEEAITRAKNNKSSIAIEILDIDYFKQYNDNYGHQAGDSCIKNVAKKMLEMRRYGKVFCARYGGDEFVIVYEGFAKDEVEKMAQELKTSIIDLQMEHKYSKVENVATISQGICWGIPTSNQRMADFLQKADDMLYEVKKISRNSVRLGEITGN